MSGFSFEVDPKYVGNVVLMKKGADDLTAQVNAILAEAYENGLYAQWYEEAQIQAGSKSASEISYDDDGNAAG